MPNLLGSDFNAQPSGSEALMSKLLGERLFVSGKARAPAPSWGGLRQLRVGGGGGGFNSLPLHGGRSGPCCPTAPDGLGWGWPDLQQLNQQVHLS